MYPAHGNQKRTVAKKEKEGKERLYMGTGGGGYYASTYNFLLKLILFHNGTGSSKRMTKTGKVVFKKKKNKRARRFRNWRRATWDERAVPYGIT